MVGGIRTRDGLYAENYGFAYLAVRSGNGSAILLDTLYIGGPVARLIGMGLGRKKETTKPKLRGLDTVRSTYISGNNNPEETLLCKTRNVCLETKPSDIW